MHERVHTLEFPVLILPAWSHYISPLLTSLWVGVLESLITGIAAGVSAAVAAWIVGEMIERRARTRWHQHREKHNR